jgi:hypothetical protein
MLRFHEAAVASISRAVAWPGGVVHRMSTNLYWRPISAGQQLPGQLKPFLAKRLWNSDGSISQEDIVVDSELIPYLEGLADAGVEGAHQLIGAIQRHRNVYISIY